MLQDEQIEAIITRSINIIDAEVAKVGDKQDTDSLSKEDTDKVIDFLKTLIIVQKEKRQIAKDEILDLKELSKDELDQAIAKEAEKLKNGQ
jgi:hypothetical protein